MPVRRDVLRTYREHVPDEANRKLASALVDRSLAIREVFTDRDHALNDIVPHLVGLTGMRFSHQKAEKGGVIRIEFEVTEPVKVLVGYFQEQRDIYLQVPSLEHVAHANDRGGIDPVLEDVAEIGDTNLTLPKINVHAFRYEAAHNTLEMIGKGSYVILGVMPAQDS
ncbi:MAG: hypothetical protein R6U98_10270 [Pirellulaceae bacterium]